MKRFTEIRKGQNAVRLLNALPGDDKPFWSLTNRGENHRFMSGAFIDALAAYENTGLTPEQIVAMKNASAFNPINFHGAAFAEAEEQLNNELLAAIRILRKSPMFEGRVTMAIVISDKGESVRPILYPTKYTPRKQNPEEATRNLPGQLTFEEE